MSTKTDHLIRALRRRWLTPLDAALSVGIFSLSQRCGELRRRGVVVIDKWVTTRGGSRIKAYRIPRGRKS